MSWGLLIVGAVIGVVFTFADNVFNGGELIGLIVMLIGWGMIVRQDIGRGL